MTADNLWKSNQLEWVHAIVYLMQYVELLLEVNVSYVLMSNLQIARSDCPLEVKFFLLWMISTEDNALLNENFVILRVLDFRGLVKVYLSLECTSIFVCKFYWMIISKTFLTPTKNNFGQFWPEWAMPSFTHLCTSGVNS